MALLPFIGVLTFGCGLLALVAACSGPRAGVAQASPPAVVEIAGGDACATPATATTESGRCLITDPPQPIYRNPTIGVIYLRAHQDEQGRLLGPQVMYEVTDPGGWNVDAVDQGKGYIPAANREMPADSPLLDADQAAHITITGLMDPADKGKAAEIASREGAGRVAVFDEQAGWLILQKDELK
jgi:hypothetical protein